jgi:AsmA protein
MMKKIVIWMAVTAALALILAVGAVVLAPLLIDLESSKAAFEKSVVETTGRPFKIGGRVRFAVFPYARFSLSDLSLGAPPGFSSPEFLSVESFEVRVKTLPLLWGDIQVTRFLIENPRLVLERTPDGRVSWEGLGRAAAESARPGPQKTKPLARTRERGFRLKGLALRDGTIRNGQVVWTEPAKSSRIEIEGLTAHLEDVSLDRPIRASVTAQVNDQPVLLTGVLGPLGRDPGGQPVPISLALTVAQGLKVTLRGHAGGAAQGHQTDLALNVEPFSPRRLFEAFGRPFPVRSSDPTALNRLALKTRILRTKQAVTFSGGELLMDDSRLTFSITLDEAGPPRLAFDLDLDRIDLDRYLPPAAPEKRAEAASSGPAVPGVETFRKRVMAGKVRIGSLRARKGEVRNLVLEVKGQEGLIRADPFGCDFYGGRLSGAATMDVRGERPAVQVQVEAAGVRVLPLLQDFLGTSFLEGLADGSASLSLAGDEAASMLGSLSGRGRLRFRDGAVVGADLAAMTLNLPSAFERAPKAEAPRTPFSELASQFTLVNGVFEAQAATLAAPGLKLSAAGRADLVKKTLRFLVKPISAAASKGQGAARPVSVLVTGDLSSPKFAPEAGRPSAETTRRR